MSKKTQTKPEPKSESKSEPKVDEFFKVLSAQLPDNVIHLSPGTQFEHKFVLLSGEDNIGRPKKVVVSLPVRVING